MKNTWSNVACLWSLLCPGSRGNEGRIHHWLSWTAPSAVVRFPDGTCCGLARAGRTFSCAAARCNLQAPQAEALLVMCFHTISLHEKVAWLPGSCQLPLMPGSERNFLVPLLVDFLLADSHSIFFLLLISFSLLFVLLFACSLLLFRLSLLH